jgi:cytochrome b-561
VFGAVALWPFVDREPEPVHFTANPLERPFPTAVGIAGVTFVMVASIAGMDVIVAEILHTSTAVLRPYFTAALVLVPAAAGTVTYGVLGGFGDDEDDASDGAGDDEQVTAAGGDASGEDDDD